MGIATPIPILAPIESPDLGPDPDPESELEWVTAALGSVDEVLEVDCCVFVAGPEALVRPGGGGTTCS